MANNLTFHIGSVFSGEGFKQCRDAVKSSNQSLKQGMESATKMAGALGTMDSSAGQATIAMTNMLQSLMTFNVTAIASQVALTGINLYVGKLKTEMEEAKKRADALNASCDKAFNSTIAAEVSGVQKEVKAISENFDRVARQAKAFTDAMNGLRSTTASGGIINLEIDKLNAMLEAHSEEERKNIEASYNLKIAKRRAADVETDAAWKISQSAEAVEASQNRVAAFDDQLAIVMDKRRTMEESLVVIGNTNAEASAKINDQIRALREQEADLLKQKDDAIAATNVLEVNHQKLQQEAANATASASIAVKNAELEQTKLTEEITARKNAECRAKLSAEQKARMDEIGADRAKEENNTRKKAADIQKSVNDSANALKKAQDDYAAALKAYEANWSDNKLYEALFGQSFDKMGNGSLGLGGGGLSAEMTEQAIKNAIANGDVRTVAELNKFAKEAQRGARDKITQTQAKVERDAKAYSELHQKNRKTWSKDDEEFARKFEALQNAALAQKRDLEQKAARVAAEEARSRENAANLKAIKEKMESLGLK